LWSRDGVYYEKYLTSTTSISPFNSLELSSSKGFFYMFQQFQELYTNGTGENEHKIIENILAHQLASNPLLQNPY
jgi:hypothetical protein